MSEIEKCPLCGKDVKKSIWRPEYEGCAGSVVVTVRCCGMEAVGIELWNQYAAAMELAYRYVESSGPHAEERQAHIAMKDHHDYLKLAQDRVLVVFK